MWVCDDVCVKVRKERKLIGMKMDDGDGDVKKKRERRIPSDD